MKIGPGVSELWGVENRPLPWLIQQLVLPYKPWYWQHSQITDNNDELS